MRVFISHSLKDKELLVNIEKIIRSWGYEPVFSEQTVHAGTITDKIKTTSSFYFGEFNKYSFLRILQD